MIFKKEVNNLTEVVHRIILIGYLGYSISDKQLKVLSALVEKPYHTSKLNELGEKVNLKEQVVRNILSMFKKKKLVDVINGEYTITKILNIFDEEISLTFVLKQNKDK